MNTICPICGSERLDQERCVKCAGNPAVAGLDVLAGDIAEMKAENEANERLEVEEISRRNGALDELTAQSQKMGLYDEVREAKELSKLPNHEEAELLATMKQDESNLARCYLESRREIASLNALLDDVYKAVGHSQLSSEPVVCAIDRLKAERDKLAGYYDEIVREVGHDCVLRELKTAQAEIVSLRNTLIDIEGVAERDDYYISPAASSMVKLATTALSKTPDLALIELKVLRDAKADMDWLQRNPQVRFVRAIQTWFKPGVISIHNAIEDAREEMP